ncbi:MAG: sigma-54 factor interaction domain-containing protein, partial [Deltaproteobacteria bacterium]
MRLGVSNPESAEGEGNIKKDEMTRYTRAFDQVTEFLTKVEARELFPQIVGQSRAMRAVFYQIVKVAPTDSIVLIQGQTGTGKEVIAESIHEHSDRRGKRFVAINCAAIPEGLLESELFGHERGAFTGASSRKPGKFEAANGGTIFLDEIGDMPLSIQAKVLRVLEDSIVERV